MFQTFSGNSRRPRQVNLSGQNTKPFAAGWNPSASGTQTTVAHAQQERQFRQQERERFNASKRIQRTWRGHKTRRELADLRRKVWDDSEQSEEALGSWEKAGRANTASACIVQSAETRRHNKTDKVDSTNPLSRI